MSYLAQLLGSSSEDEGTGGLLGILNPTRMAYLGMIAKGLSPHSAIDPQAMLIQAQRLQAAREERKREERRHQELMDLRNKQFGLDQSRFGLEQQRFGISQAAEDRKARIEQRQMEDDAASVNLLTPGQQSSAAASQDTLQGGDVSAQQTRDEALKEQVQKLEEGLAKYRFMNPANQKMIRDKIDSLRDQIGVPEGLDPSTYRKKQTEMELTRRAGEAQRQVSSGAVATAIKEADKLIDDGWLTTGLGGQVTSMIGGTDARNLRAKLDTIKANVGFDRLQKMRELSPTGGALGQVAVEELRKLEATIASLDQAQSAGDLKKSLREVATQYGVVMGLKPDGVTSKGDFRGNGYTIKSVR